MWEANAAKTSARGMSGAEQRGSGLAPGPTFGTAASKALAEDWAEWWHGWVRQAVGQLWLSSEGTPS